jgi:succinate dehydrogenase / fumarate reductase iron-sulfur subunit
MRFSVYRYNPDVDAKPYMQDYDVPLEPTDQHAARCADPSQGARRHAGLPPLLPGRCLRLGRHEHQRSAMAWPASPTVAELGGHVTLRPIPGLPVIRDLIVDMTQFFRAYHSVKPYVINNDPPPENERLQSPGGPRSSSTASTNASCAPAAARHARRSGGTPTSSSGRPGCCRAYRFIADSRDQATNERLDDLEDPYQLFRCHSIMNCVDVCPKGLNPTRAIGKIKDIMIKRMV